MSKHLCYFLLSLEVPLHSVLYQKLVVEKMDLLEDGAPNSREPSRGQPRG